MVDGARNRAILNDVQIIEIESKFKTLFDAKPGIEKFVESIGNTPITFDEIKKLSQDQGLDFQLIKEVINREAEKGTIFISGTTVQRL
jgi:hypothetical protein